MNSVALPNNNERWLITISVMLVAIIEVLDSTIVNVSLPYMMGELGANTEQITWVLTSYIVSSGIFMLLTGFLVGYFGRKKLLLVNIVGFLLASMLCGISTSLWQIVFFRTLQGIFGASLVPLSQYVLRDTFTQEEQGKAMAIWGIGIMAAPVLGPTIGGYITETLNWRWVFFINLPVCILAFLMAAQVIKDTPIKHIKIDWNGLLLMAVGVASLQIFLDRGNTSDWFNSNSIVILFIMWVSTLTIFIVRGLHKKDNILNFSLFTNINFAASTIMLALFALAIFSVISLQPILLEDLMNYPAQNAGLLMMPRGVAAAFSMMLIGKYMNRLNLKIVIIMGVLMCAYGTYLTTHFNLQISAADMIWPEIWQGLGMGLFFVPLSTTALSTLPHNSIAEASGLFSFGRNIGSSIGISIMSTMISRKSQINWNSLASHFNANNPNLQYWLQAHHMSLADPATISTLVTDLSNQASMIAFNDASVLTTWLFLIIIPFAFLINGRPSKISMAH